MTQEDKSILLQDLCARLPYGVKVQPLGSASPHKFVGYDKSLARLDTDQRFELENIKPYLRPMSSMTEEEKYEFNSYYNMFNNNPVGLIDWLNAHHFDYRGLIEKGLALETLDDMYNT